MVDRANGAIATTWEGRVLRGKYRIARRIGVGGWGAVYEAEHLLLRRSVAIKLLHPDYARDPRFAERFRREALAASRIGHPNIIEVLDLDRTDDGTQFMVLELLHGESFGDVVAKRRRLPFATALAIFEPITSALAAAHAAGIVHRDIKPDNIFLCYRDGGNVLPKLLDFGIAKVNPLLSDTPNTITQTGAVLGTPVFMPPEQVRGDRSLDHRADIYSLGVVFYEAIAGALPIDGENLPDVVMRILDERPVSVDVHRADTPRALVALIDRMLAKDPADRPQSCEEILATLRSVSSELARDDSDDATTVFGPGVSAEISAETDAMSDDRDTMPMVSARTPAVSEEMFAIDIDVSGERRLPSSASLGADHPPSVVIRVDSEPPRTSSPRVTTPADRTVRVPTRRKQDDRAQLILAVAAFVVIATISYWLVSQL